MFILFFFLDLILSTKLIPTTVVHVVLQVLQLQCINYNHFIQVDKSKYWLGKNTGGLAKMPGPASEKAGPSFE